MADLEKETTTLALEAWRELPARLFYPIAERLILEKGLKIFANKSVEKLSWSAKRPRWEAIVCGGRSYKSWVQNTNGKIIHHCNCHVHKDDGVCPHVVAVVALLFYITKHKVFGSRAIHSAGCRNSSF